MTSTPEPITLTVDGHDFLVLPRADERGVYDFHWLTGPHDYGFTETRSDRSAISEAEAAESIRNFLAQIDPTAGHIE